MSGSRQSGGRAAGGRERANISVFALMPDPEEDAVVARLRADLASGAWAERILALDARDVGCRILVAAP